MAKNTPKRDKEKPMFFSSFNYKLIGIAIALILSGFAAMYWENEVQGFISLYVSPLVIMAGYVLVIFAILKHDRPDEEEASAAG